MSEIHLELDDCWNQHGVWSRSGADCPELQHYIHCRNCPCFSEAGQKILDRQIPENYSRDWADIYAQPKDERRIGTIAVVIFRVGDEWFAIPTRIVREVSEMRPVRRLPHRGNGLVAGLVNLHGELKICVSLGRLLAIDRSGQREERELHTVYERMIAIVRNGKELVFRVTEIAGDHRYHPDELYAPPATVSGAKESFSLGSFDYQDKNIIVLDDELLFNALERGLA